MAENNENGAPGDNGEDQEASQGQSQEGQQGGEDKGKGGAGEGSGEAGKSWLASSGLSEETLKDPSLQNFLKDENPQKFLDSHLSLRKMVGNSVRIPGDDATPEEITAFKDKFRPEIVEGQPIYDYTPPEDMAHPELFNQELLDETQKQFHEEGFSQAQYLKAMDIYDNVIKTFDAKNAEDFAQAEINCKDTLQKDPGWRGGGYERNQVLAKAGVDYLFGADPQSEARAFLDDAKIMGSNPHFVKAMNKLGRAISEGSGAENKIHTTALDGLTSQDAASEINAVRTDPNHRFHAAYRDATHKDNAEAKKYVSHLYTLKSPGNQKPAEVVGKNQ